MLLSYETSAIVIYKELCASQTKACKISLKHSVGWRED